VRRVALVALAFGVLGTSAACGGGAKKAEPAADLLHPQALTAKAPTRFDVTFTTTKGDFTITVERSWAPNGADRFYNLAKAHFFDGVKFFRVVPNFVVQFGISPDPEVSKQWRSAAIPDDIVTVHNERGGVTFAAAGPNTRTTQVFINLGDNRSLDNSGFAPFGAVTHGMDVVSKLYAGYGDEPTPHQAEMQLQGNAWLEKTYPKLDSIKTARVTSESNPALP
jgi:peptidyl-prolyl cis-trans isomerase A (cyclophilin A)